MPSASSVSRHRTITNPEIRALSFPSEEGGPAFLALPSEYSCTGIDSKIGFKNAYAVRHAVAIGEPGNSSQLKAEIARFLHNRKDDEALRHLPE